MYHCYSEEDVLGLLKPLAQYAITATARHFERTMLRRYMIRPAGEQRHAIDLDLDL